MTDIFNFLYLEIDEAPKTFGIFHFITLGLVILGAFLVIKYYKGDSDAVFRRIMLTVWLVILCGEIYRDIYYSFDLEDGVLIYDFSWYQFPFQLCSSPLYALPFLIFLKEGKLRDGFAAFLALFSFFGGIAVIIYPGNVFTATIGISIQSMIHHSCQVLIALFIAKRNREKYNTDFFKRGLYVFLGFVSAAMLLNVVFYLVFTANGITDDFNMFYISPFYDSSLPVFSTIQEMSSGWLMAPLYLTLFIPTAYLIFRIQKLLLERKSGNV